MTLSKRLKNVNKRQFETVLTERIQEVFSQQCNKEVKKTLCKILLFLWRQSHITNIAGHMQDMGDVLSGHDFEGSEISKILQTTDEVTPEMEKEIGSLSVNQGGLNTKWSQLPNLTSLTRVTPLGETKPHTRHQS